MTPDTLAAKCRAAGLTVLSVEQVGAQVGVEVERYSVTTETVLKRLKQHGVVGVTVSFGSGRGNVTLWVMAEEA